MKYLLSHLSIESLSKREEGRQEMATQLFIVLALHETACMLHCEQSWPLSPSYQWYLFLVMEADTVRFFAIKQDRLKIQKYILLT